MQRCTSATSVALQSGCTEVYARPAPQACTLHYATLAEQSTAATVAPQGGCTITVSSSLDSQALAAVANFRPHRSAFESSTKAHFHRLAPLKASLAIAASAATLRSPHVAAHYSSLPEAFASKSSPQFAASIAGNPLAVARYSSSSYFRQHWLPKA